MKGTLLIIPVSHYTLSCNDCSIRVYRSFNTIFHQMINTAIIRVLISRRPVVSREAKNLCWHCAYN